MVAFASTHLGIWLPDHPEVWIVSRADITQNIMLDSLSDVRVALRYLRECEGGRYRVSQQAETPFIGHTVVDYAKVRLMLKVPMLSIW